MTGFRASKWEGLEVPRAPSLELISRLPIIDAKVPLPVPVEVLARCIPGYDPWRDAGDRYVFDAERAERAVRFFPRLLRLTKGERGGRPFVLQAWQAAIVANLFGWVDRETGLRRFREVFLAVPRKNGKSELAAGLALLLLLADGEVGPEVYCAASTRDQAALVYGAARRMVEQGPESLRKRVEVLKSAKVLEGGGGVLKVVSSEAGGVHGGNASGIIVDELHAHRDGGELLAVLETSQGARAQPVELIISTADFAGESPYNRRLELALRVRDGILPEPTMLPVVYRLEAGESWDTPEKWWKANPNHGVSIREEEFERSYRKARAEPSYATSFLRLHLNVTTQSERAWLRPESIAAAGRRLVDVASLEGELCYGGLDLASTRDLCSFALWFPRREAALTWSWVPALSAKGRQERDQVPYLAWIREGHLRETPGEVTDARTIIRDVLELTSIHRPTIVAFDRYGSQEVVRELKAGGVDVLSFGQGFVSMSPPTKALETLVEAGRLKTDGSPLLLWALGNVVLEEDAAGNVKVSKARARERIDPVAALVMAIGAAQLQEAPKRSVYGKRGVQII